MNEGVVRVMLLGIPRLFRDGLRVALEAAGDVKVTAEGETDEDARHMLATCEVDVCLVDLDQPGGGDLLSVALEIAQGRPLSVTVLTGRVGVLGLSEALDRGVSGVVATDQVPETLRKAIHKVHAGEVWLNRCMTAGVLSQLAPARRGRGHGYLPAAKALTAREREIVALVGRGLRNGEIARALYISDVTVRNHLTSVFRKLGLSSRVALAAHAYQQGLVSLPLRAGPPLKSTPESVRQKKQG